MGAGKVLARIGAIIGLLNIGLTIFLESLLPWYRVEVSGPGDTGFAYVTGLGTVDSTIEQYDLFLLGFIVGIIVIIGAILCLVSAAKGSKAMGIIGGIMMLAGPLLLIMDLLLGISEIAQDMDQFVDTAGGSIFWGSYSDGSTYYVWGLGFGFFLALGGGILGLIGGATVSEGY